MRGSDDLPDDDLPDDDLPDDDLPDDELPAETDPYWAELTADTFGYLRRLRAAERRRRIGSAVYAAYVVAVVALVYVVPYVWYALTRPGAPAPERTAAGWVLGAVGVVGLVLVGFFRDGGWRGPAVVDRATAAWLLPSPTLRRALLAPRWYAALVAGAAAGLVAGALAGVALRVATGGQAAQVAAGGAAAGLLVGAGGTALGGFAETARRPLRAGPLLWLPPAVLLVAAVLVARSTVGVVPGTAPSGSDAYSSTLTLTFDPGPADAVAAVLLWSGPWGWAVQPLVAALPGRAPSGVDALWPVGLGLALAAVLLAVRRVDGPVTTVAATSLRARADSVALVGASIMSLQPRRARLSVLAAQGHAPSTRLRLPVPRRPLLLGPWRDATALLRAPSRLVWSVLWLVVAVLALGAAWSSGITAAAAGSVAARAATGERVILGVPGFVALYLAAAQLAEPARLDADDVRRLRIRPTAATRQVLAHAVVPMLGLGALLGASLLVVWARAGVAPWATSFGGVTLDPDGGPGGVLLLRAGLLDALVGLPLMVGAALVSAYRGEVPLQLISSGAGSPMGDPGPAALLAWYARAPLVATALLVPVLLGWSIAVPLALGAAAMHLVWAGTRAEAMLRA